MLSAHTLAGAHVVTSLAGALPAYPRILVTISDLWLTFIIGTVLPAVVALVTKRFAAGAVKAAVLAVLAVVAGALVQIQASGGTFDLTETVVAVFMTSAAAVIAHFGYLKPLNVTGADGVIARAVPGGIGSDVRTRENSPDGYGGTPSTPVADPSRSYVDGDPGLE